MRSALAALLLLACGTPAKDRGSGPTPISRVPATPVPTYYLLDGDIKRVSGDATTVVAGAATSAVVDPVHAYLFYASDGTYALDLRSSSSSPVLLSPDSDSDFSINFGDGTWISTNDEAVGLVIAEDETVSKRPGTPARIDSPFWSALRGRTKASVPEVYVDGQEPFGKTGHLLVVGDGDCYLRDGDGRVAEVATPEVWVNAREAGTCTSFYFRFDESERWWFPSGGEELCSTTGCRALPDGAKIVGWERSGPTLHTHPKEDEP